MIGLLTGLGLSQGLSRILAPLIGLAVVLALCAALWARGNHYRDQRDVARADLRLAEAQIALLNTQAELVETAAVERQADTAAVAEAEKELIDAISEVPDTMPDAVRVRLGCERLRRAGYLDADLPSGCRSGGGGETGAFAGNRD